jgi:hypothetical protein
VFPAWLAFASNRSNSKEPGWPGLEQFVKDHIQFRYMKLLAGIMSRWVGEYSKLLALGTLGTIALLSFMHSRRRVPKLLEPTFNLLQGGSSDGQNGSQQAGALWALQALQMHCSFSVTSTVPATGSRLLRLDQFDWILPHDARPVKCESPWLGRESFFFPGPSAQASAASPLRLATDYSLSPRSYMHLVRMCLDAGWPLTDSLLDQY